MLIEERTSIVQDGQDDSRRNAILAAVCLAAFTLPFSFSAGAVATPSIGATFGGEALSRTWITNAFMLTFGSTLMAAGALADQFGRRRVFLIGVGAFAAFSLLISLAASLLWLDLLRAGQGFAAAAALAGGSAALAQEFDGAERARAFSVLGTTFGVGLAVGSFMAGLMVQVFGWRTIFLLGACIGLTAWLVARRSMRESRDPNAQGLDWPGAIGFSLTLALFTVAVLQAPQAGWSSHRVIFLLVASAVAAIAFVATELLVSRPMLDLSLFRFPRFVGVQMLPVATCACYVVLLVLLPQRFISIEGRSSLQAGALMMALSAPVTVIPLLAGRLAHAISPRLLSFAGLMVAAGGLVWLAAIPLGAAPGTLLLPLLVIGAGTGLPWGLMDALSVSVVPQERAGMASGIFGTTRVAGEGVALAVVSAVMAELIRLRLRPIEAVSSAGNLTRANTLLGHGDIAAQIYASAFTVLLHGLAVVTVAAAAIVLLCLSEQRVRQP